MKEPTNVRRAPTHEQETHPEAKRISFFATDGAIPLNFMPLPKEYDPQGRSTEGDIAVDRALARVSGWIHRPVQVVARWATPFVNLSRKSVKHTAGTKDI